MASVVDAQRPGDARCTKQLAGCRHDERLQQQDVQRKVEPARDFERRGHASANDAENECVPVGAVRHQYVSQCPARCAEVHECDVRPHLRNDLSVHGATQSGTTALRLVRAAGAIIPPCGPRRSNLPPRCRRTPLVMPSGCRCWHGGRCLRCNGRNSSRERLGPCAPWPWQACASAIQVPASPRSSGALRC